MVNLLYHCLNPRRPRTASHCFEILNRLLSLRSYRKSLNRRTWNNLMLIIKTTITRSPKVCSLNGPRIGNILLLQEIIDIPINSKKIIVSIIGRKLTFPEQEAEILHLVEESMSKGLCVLTGCLRRRTVKIIWNSYSCLDGTQKSECANKIKGARTWILKFMHRKNIIQK